MMERSHIRQFKLIMIFGTASLFIAKAAVLIANNPSMIKMIKDSSIDQEKDQTIYIVDDSSKNKKYRKSTRKEILKNPSYILVKGVKGAPEPLYLQIEQSN